MTQIGCVLVFRPGVDPNEVIAKLKALESIADVDYSCVNPSAKNAVPTRDGQKVVTALYKFDTDQGGPVWYVP